MSKINAQIDKPATSASGALAPLGDNTQVRGRLALLGWSSLASWSEAHGYSRAMASYVVKHWGNRADRPIPHGGIARHLMRALRQTLDTGKRPEDMPTEQTTKAK
jgi:hypothetical protein